MTRSRRGETLAEVLLAAVLLTAGLGPVAGALARQQPRVRHAGGRAHAAILAERLLDSLRLAPCPIQGGADAIAGVTRQWTVVDSLVQVRLGWTVVGHPDHDSISGRLECPP